MYFETFYPQFYFAPENIEEDLQVNLKSYNYLMSMNSRKIDRLFVSTIQLFDDLGWILDNVKFSQSLGFAEVQSEVSF